MSKINILITGANGYIGNCLFNFLKKNFNVSGLDRNNTFNKRIYKCDIMNIKKFEKILDITKPKLIVHLAAQSLVDETINEKKYYRNNILATNVLLDLMERKKIKNIIFSSTASIYKKNTKPLKENSNLQPLSCYAKTKFICEKDIKKQKQFNHVILRFFNVCSALSEPLVGELHKPETHLVPTVTYKGLKKKTVYIYGKDFNTPDGTCIRDYVHIKDICIAIKKSIIFLFKNKKSLLLNIGNSNGISNNDIVNFVEKKIKRKIKVKFEKRRRGDVSSLICNAKKAKYYLSWTAKNSTIDKIVKNEIRWIKKLDKDGLKRKFKNYI